MGKKGKGAKKEDKPKKDASSTKVIPKSDAAKLKEALEANTVSVGAAAPPARSSASKKSERGGVVGYKIGCTESFRWGNSEEAPLLLPMKSHVETLLLNIRTKIVRSPFIMNNVLKDGWPCYLGWRCENESDRTSKTLRDGLSAPLTIVHMIIQWHQRRQDISSERWSHLENGDPLHVVVIGATAVNEEKVLRETTYWDDLFHIFNKRRVRLYLTGPEMSGKDGVYMTGRKDGQENAPEMHVECWKARAVDFFLQKNRLDVFKREDTVVVGLNCGFGMALHRHLTNLSPKQPLPSDEVLWKWIPTLFFLAALDLPLMITASSVEDYQFAQVVLKHAVGMYSLLGFANALYPFESVASGQGEGNKVVRANSFMAIVQGQQPGHSFAAEPSPFVPGNRTEVLRSMAARDQTSHWPQHPSILHGGTRDPVAQRPPLVPLKRYGKYPPHKVSGVGAGNRKASETSSTGPRDEDSDSSDSSDDDSESESERESDVPATAYREREAMGRVGEGCNDVAHPTPLPASLELKHSINEVVKGESRALNITLEDVFMTDPATARVGVRRNSIALYYFDCRELRDVVFKAPLPADVDHTTTEVLFQPSEASVEILVQLASGEK